MCNLTKKAVTLSGSGLRNSYFFNIHFTLSLKVLFVRRALQAQRKVNYLEQINLSKILIDQKWFFVEGNIIIFCLLKVNQFSIYGMKCVPTYCKCQQQTDSSGLGWSQLESPSSQLTVSSWKILFYENWNVSKILEQSLHWRFILVFAPLARTPPGANVKC